MVRYGGTLLALPLRFIYPIAYNNGKYSTALADPAVVYHAVNSRSTTSSWETVSASTRSVQAQNL